MVPNVAYTLSQNETSVNEEQNDDIEKASNVEYTSAYDSPEDMADIQIVEQQIYKEFSVDDQNSASAYMSIIGAFLGMISMFAIKIGSRAIHRLQRKQSASLEKTEIDYSGGAMI